MCKELVHDSNRERGRAPLPTRCIRVDKSTSLPNRLNYSLEETGGRLGEYVSLSHRWSNPETPRSSTYLRNYHRLVALSGVAQEFTTQESSTKLVCRLRPWCLGTDLLWKQDTAGIHSRYIEFPSWSWASVNTSVSWIRTGDATDSFSALSVSSTPGGRATSSAKTGGNSTSPTSTPSGTALQAIATPSFALEASMNTLNIRCRLLTVSFGSVLEEKSRDLVLRASRYPTEELPSTRQP
ncbi:uncharacterized protein FFUJ_12822 [Fusarium fujikuroi IMI 58289]|uniref:Heterokaryon incompatibility domain-containing protein n=1 Tax=Gibberella fujikuroi (strain CBS 195.34 / IMI 58289 / NRRL A-6831) TaxID=1279085 RepID=S0EE38_GIBF5|nr:uncharacterized protein FFUJ_12822 [Fusarium fujikuroi IMI 58289]CCT72925.1 uncharacterized protein FFUJ_12822 [Fusarium fujikuroi IMI 58289]SCO24926.1 uncharacterized protein FFM5_13879 [Fusarium fujikuroi]SCO53972.1 uncharacterized protein FFMR_11582 [Fusarium fujikuroi]